MVSVGSNVNGVAWPGCVACLDGTGWNGTDACVYCLFGQPDTMVSVSSRLTFGSNPDKDIARDGKAWCFAVDAVVSVGTNNDR